MSPSDVLAALTSLLKTKRPIFLWGAPGVGKSSIVRQAASSLGLALIDLRASLLDPVDLHGLPTVSDGVTRWCPPGFLPQSGEGILFLDELSQAVPNVQSALLSLCLERKLGEYQMPDGWTIVAASNRAEDRAGGHRIISSLQARFIHLDADVSESDWQDWAVAAGMAPEVRAFLRFRPALLFQFDASSNPRSFPSPRSWSFVSEVLSHTPENLLQRVVSGCVGEGPAAEFAAFVTLFRQLPDIDDVLRNPTTAPVPREPAVLYSLVSAVTERLRQGKAAGANVARYVTRFPDEFAMLGMREAMAVDKKMHALPEVQSWIAASRKKGLFIAA